MPAESIARRKKSKFKSNNVIRAPKTNRTEFSVVARPFAVGALTAMRGDYSSQRQLARTIGRSQGTLSELLKRVEAKANDHTVALWDEILYKNDLGRGRSSLLTRQEKEKIVQLATSSREAREKKSWQPIADGDFEDVVPEMSITTFENVMYEIEYARRAPEKERYKWALAHNPDKYKEYDNQGFDFRIVVFSDETPARVGEQRGMMRIWFRGGEKYNEDVKHDRNRSYYCLQSYSCFRHGLKGPCHVYSTETAEEKLAAEGHIRELNADQKTRDNKLQIYARQALSNIGEGDVGLCSKSSHGSNCLKNKDFNVYYNKMELLLKRLEFLVIYLSWRRSIGCGGQITRLRSTHPSMPGLGFGGT
ncbi:hypothetical protein C7974DRAFT_446141 [Boeremia exigua]|uniref:uncharacterized protein n=1 Tax=Boeremia exigua TaxID=749465 RepID=UPI001E8DDC20|nr:uncharacterized protein C7974DRAFT_446141 [Boeremia exigua]KAH6611673.1 hypothetical protein C7974DRAFT_446141 [Boeremia exigua]